VAGYQGAFGAINWAADWTALGTYGVFTGAGAGVPVDVIPSGGQEPPTAPILGIVQSGANVQITCSSQTGATYQLQSTTTLLGNPLPWANEGDPQAGTGSTLTFSASISGIKFFRVVAQ
jgi:hypothetical protein